MPRDSSFAVDQCIADRTASAKCEKLSPTNTETYLSASRAGPSKPGLLHLSFTILVVGFGWAVEFLQKHMSPTLR